MRDSVNKHLTKFLAGFGVSLLLFLLKTFLVPVDSLAACNFYTSMTTQNKDVVWQSVCTISTLDGVDSSQLSENSINNSGALTISTNGAITINSAGKLFIGRLEFSGGNIAIQNGGLVKVGFPIYITDADADGWPADFTLVEATASGARRLALMRSYTVVDCNDTNDYRENNVCCTPVTWYRDADADGYGTATTTTSSCTQPAGYVNNTSDCYDGNANAKPGSAYCGTANRGDGSFDYNCSATQTKCGTIYNYSTTSTFLTVNHGTGSCTNNNARCRANNAYIYGGATYGCGATGAICSSLIWHEEGCGDCGESPDSQYRCTGVATGIQSCQ